MLGAPEARILEALYTERRWPRALERSLGYLAGVVEALADAQASGWTSEHFEFYALAEGFQGQAFSWPTSFLASLPGWTTSSGYVIALFSGNGADSGACATPDGVTLSINGHPEIKATYFKDNVSLDPTLTATNSVGIGAIGPVPPGTYEIDGTKAGCTIAPLSDTDFKFATTTTVSAGIITGQLLHLQ